MVHTDREMFGFRPRIHYLQTERVRIAVHRRKPIEHRRSSTVIHPRPRCTAVLTEFVPDHILLLHAPPTYVYQYAIGVQRIDLDHTLRDFNLWLFELLKGRPVQRTVGGAIERQRPTCAVRNGVTRIGRLTMARRHTEGEDILV